MGQKWSQVFLVDNGIADKIISESGIVAGDSVIEIGPGRGMLTGRLASIAGKLVAIEIDPALSEKLRGDFSVKGNVEVLNSDFLEIDLESMLRRLENGRGKTKIISNLPYSSATPIIMKILSVPSRPDSFECVFMLQEEVAQRICAVPGGRDYGTLTVAVQYRAGTSYLFGVPRGKFRPVPKVDSAVIRLVPLEKPPVRVEDEDIFFKLVRVAFMHRRKKLHNSIKSMFTLELDELKDVINGAGISADSRPEDLSLDDFAGLANGFHARKAVIAGVRKAER